MRLADRVGKVKPSPTLTVDAKAKAMKAAGVDLVSFGAGEPDFDTPDNIKDAAIKAIEGGFTRYTPVGGIDELKDAIIKKFKRDNGLEYTREEIVVNCGGKHSFYNLAQALFQKGDEVIIPAPYWVSYPPMVILADAEPVIIETREEDGFKVKPEALLQGHYRPHPGSGDQQPLQPDRRHVRPRGSPEDRRNRRGKRHPGHIGRYLRKGYF